MFRWHPGLHPNKIKASSLDIALGYWVAYVNICRRCIWIFYSIQRCVCHLLYSIWHYVGFLRAVRKSLRGGRATAFPFSVVAPHTVVEGEEGRVTCIRHVVFWPIKGKSTRAKTRAKREQNARNMRVFPAADYTAPAPSSPSLMDISITSRLRSEQSAHCRKTHFLHSDILIITGQDIGIANWWININTFPGESRMSIINTLMYWNNACNTPNTIGFYNVYEHL